MSDSAKRIIVGIAGPYVTAIPEARCNGLIAYWQSGTWGEFRRAAPAEFVEEVDDRIRTAIDAGMEREWPGDQDVLDHSMVPGASDGDWPFPHQDMLDLVPEEIADRFGGVIATTLNGDLLAIMPEEIDAFVQAMTDAGFTCVRNDHAVSKACGM
jgi:hypothetical protein